MPCVTVCAQVGIIPTDSYPAIVCDLGNAEATQKLAAIKRISLSKPLSILVKGFADVDEYTLGWPAATEPGAAPAPASAHASLARSPIVLFSGSSQQHMLRQVHKCIVLVLPI